MTGAHFEPGSPRPCPRAPTQSPVPSSRPGIRWTVRDPDPPPLQGPTTPSGTHHPSHRRRDTCCHCIPVPCRRPREGTTCPFLPGSAWGSVHSQSSSGGSLDGGGGQWGGGGSESRGAGPGPPLRVGEMHSPALCPPPSHTTPPPLQLFGTQPIPAPPPSPPPPRSTRSNITSLLGHILQLDARGCFSFFLS